MGFRLPQGSEKREAVGAEYWKPAKPGDVLLGRVEKFTTNSMGETVTISPCIAWPVAGEPTAYKELAVGVNSSLSKRLSHDDAGTVVAIQFTGKQTTPKGAMRLYEVATVPEESFAENMKKYGAALVEDDEPADDLPF